VRVSANYAQGPVTVDVDNTSYKEGSVGGINVKSRLLIGGSYDLGVAKLSAGFQTYKFRDAGDEKLKENVLGVSMPVASNVSVGLTYATAKAGSGAGAAGAVDVKGYDLGATYSLSKRTNVNFSYASTNTGRKDNAGADITNKQTRVKLTHSF
jgi:predicted porin